MRAAVFEGVGRPLTIRTLPDPRPEAGHVVIRVGRCGVCGTDLHMTESHDTSYPAGVVPGHELAGEVVAIGRGVDGVTIGDRVTALSLVGCGRCVACRGGDPIACAQVTGLWGGFGEYTTARADTLVKLPATLSLADGALVEPLACGLHGVLAADLSPGSRVLVLGAGAIGQAALFWARRLGAGRIAVAAHSRRGEEVAMRIGADAFLDPQADRAEAAAQALGGAPDVVFECVGRPGLIGDAIGLVRMRGTVVVLSMCAQRDTLFPAVAAMKEVRLRFAIAYNLREFERAADTLGEGALEPRAMVTGTVTLDALPEAFEGLRSGSRHCKLMVAPGT